MYPIGYNKMTDSKYWRFFCLYGYYKKHHLSVVRKVGDKVKGVVIENTKLYPSPFSVREGWTPSIMFFNWIIYKHDR